MSGPGQGLRSEPTVERRVQKILTACHDAPETLARMNLDDKIWKSDWSFLRLAAPEHCGEYLTATLSDKPRDDRDTLARLLEDTDTYRSPQAIGVALDWIRVYDDNEDEFAGVLAKIITTTVGNIAEHPDQQAGWDCMAMLVDRFGAAKRTDMLAPPRNIVHLMVDTLCECERSFLWKKSQRADHTEQEIEAVANQLFALVGAGGADFDFPMSNMIVGRERPITPLMSACRRYEQTGGVGRGVIRSLLNHGAYWFWDSISVGPKAGDVIENHPKVKADKLLEVANDSGAAEETGGTTRKRKI